MLHKFEDFYCKVHENVQCIDGSILAKINLWKSTGEDITQCPILKVYDQHIQWIPFEKTTIEAEHIMLVPHLKYKNVFYHNIYVKKF